jgi:integrase
MEETMWLIKSLTSAALYDLLKYIGTPKSQHWYDVKQTARNLLATLLMSDAGLRIGEVLSLRIGDLWNHEKPGPRKILTVQTEKSKLLREVPLTKRVQTAIVWMYHYGWAKNRRTSPELPAFSSHKGKVLEPMTSRQLQRIIKQAGKEVLGRKVTPHMLRHTFATRLMKKNNIRVVQILLGHGSISSTQVYTHPSSEDCQNAIDSLS